MKGPDHPVARVVRPEQRHPHQRRRSQVKPLATVVAQELLNQALADLGCVLAEVSRRERHLSVGLDMLTRSGETFPGKCGA